MFERYLEGIWGDTWGIANRSNQEIFSIATARTNSDPKLVAFGTPAMIQNGNCHILAKSHNSQKLRVPPLLCSERFKLFTDDGVFWAPAS
jgi:hypothetical protein